MISYMIIHMIVQCIGYLTNLGCAHSNGTTLDIPLNEKWDFIIDQVCPRQLAEFTEHESETACEVLDSEVSLPGSALAAQPEPEAASQSSSEGGQGGNQVSSSSLEDILDDAWERVMYGSLPQTMVEDWKSADREFANFFRANPGQLPVNSNKGKIGTQPEHLNLHDKHLMPTPSEIAFLRAGQGSTEAEMDEWLNVIKDPEFKVADVRWGRARQSTRLLKKTSSIFCNLRVRQHLFTSTDSKSCPFGALVDCM